MKLACVAYSYHASAALVAIPVHIKRTISAILINVILLLEFVFAINVPNIFLKLYLFFSS
jgi:hypothetical protein